MDRDRNIGRTLSTFPDEFDAIDIDRVSPAGADLVRWCWGRDCTLMSQDEDLLLMSDALMLPLLDEAARYCTKRDYALSIVGHHARDSVHHALWGAAPALADRLALIGRWAPLAAAAKADDLHTYLARLASYGKRHAVTREEVRQRVLDVRRCAPGKDVPEIEQDVADWVVPLQRANLLEGRLRINRETGAMRAEQVQQ